MAGPEYVAASKESRHQFFAEANFVGGKPGRRRPAKQSRALLARFIMLDIRFKVTENLLETHFVQRFFVAFGRALLTGLIPPKPVIDQAVFGNQPVHLL